MVSNKSAFLRALSCIDCLVIRFIGPCSIQPTKATLTVRKAGKDALEYIVIEMEEVIITSVSTGGSGGEDRLTENIALNFAKFNFKYKQQTPKGAGEAFKECKWDIAENVAW